MKVSHNNRSALIVGNFLEGAPLQRYVSGDLAVRLAANGWRIHITSRKHSRLARLADMLKTACTHHNEYSFALVDVFSGPAFVWAELVCWTLRRLGKPYVLTLHGGNLPAFSRRWPTRVHCLLGAAAAVTAPSRYLQEQMRRFRSDLELVPNPLDLGAYSFKLRQQAVPKLVWLRAFHGIYNPLLGVHVTKQVAATFPHTALVMIGPDKGDGSLKRSQQLAKELNVAGQITFAGTINKNDVSKWLNEGDIFLNTTNVDNTPISVLEAMACGLCTVSTDVGGIPYLLNHGQDALLVPANNSAAMADAVGCLLRDSLLAQRISRNGRRTVEQFDWARIYPQWERLFESVAQRQ